MRRSPGRTCCELELSVDRVESNPQLVQIIPANEVVILVSFELTVGETRGMVNLVHPVQFDRAHQSQAHVQQLGELQQAPADGLSRFSWSAIGFRKRPWKWSWSWRKRRSPRADLIGLRVGDIIASEKDIHQPLTVSVEGNPKFAAQPGQFKGRKAIEILHPLEEQAVKISAAESSPPPEIPAESA